MPPKFQNNIVIAGLIITMLSLLLVAAGSILLWVSGMNIDTISFHPALPAWYLFAVPEQGVLFSILAGLFALLLYSFFAATGLWGLFRRTGSPEIFFTMIFIFSLVLEGLKIGMIGAKIWTWPGYLSIALTRGVYVGRFFGLFSLLVASLYGAGMKYSNYSTLLAGLLLLALTLAKINPVDWTLLQVNFLHKLGDYRVYAFVNGLIGFLILLNYLKAALTRRNRRFLLVALSGLFLFLGKELLHLGISPPVVIAGLLLLMGGIVLFARQMGVIYLGV